MSTQLTDLVLHIPQADFATTQSPLRERREVKMLLNILACPNNASVHMLGATSDLVKSALFQGIAAQLAETPLPFAESDLWYFHGQKGALWFAEPKILTRDFKDFYESHRVTKKRVLLGVNTCDWLEELGDAAAVLKYWLGIFLQDPNFCVLMFSETSKTLPFPVASSTILWSGLTDEESSALLCSHKAHLESVHQVEFAEGVFTEAFCLTKRYLPRGHLLDDAYQLLVGAATLAKRFDPPDPSMKIRTPVTQAVLAQWISMKTGIPASLIASLRFLPKNLQDLSLTVPGQKEAVRILRMSHENFTMTLLKQALPAFLFVGQYATGKTKMARTICETLYGNAHAFVSLSLADQSPSNFLEMHSSRCAGSLGEIITRMPYAVLVLSGLEQAKPLLLNQIADIVEQGYLYDAKSAYYDFSQATLILMTSLGDEHFSAPLAVDPSSEALMDIILQRETASSKNHFSAYRGSMVHALKDVLPKRLLRRLLWVPFYPLDDATYETIIRRRLSFLSQCIVTAYGLELRYVEDIIGFLARIATKEHLSADDTLARYLYPGVIHVLAACEGTRPSGQLVLQLDGQGQQIRCEFLSPQEVTHLNI